MKSLTKTTTFAMVCLAVLLTYTSGAYAANWLMLQGTEPAMAAPVARVWGFIQPEYQETDGTKIKAGGFSGQNAIFNQIRPDLKTNESFNVIRARVGVRGQPLPLDSKVNYFFLAEFGNNGITREGGGSTKITDASVTLSHIPGARIRVGQFKHPGSEEGLQAIHVFDYINFTNVTNQLTLERFFNRDGIPGCTVAVGGTSSLCGNKPNGPVSAFRDVGVQVFDAFERGDWEHSYAVMYGNGNGIARGDNDDNKDVYLYWSSERIYGGKGPRRQGLKIFVWKQDGKRTIVTGGTGTQSATDGSTSTAGTSGEFDRERSGAGVTYRKGKIRAGFEYIKADGMIFNGTDGAAVAGSRNNAGTAFATFNVLTTEEADGFYVDFGYYIKPNWTIDLRYDELNRGTKVAANERKFETLTVGTQYFFNKKSRVLVNYEFRDAEAPNLASTSNPNLILGGMDDRVSVQLLTIF